MEHAADTGSMGRPERGTALCWWSICARFPGGDGLEKVSEAKYDMVLTWKAAESWHWWELTIHHY
jgi:hypothetical protein